MYACTDDLLSAMALWLYHFTTLMIHESAIMRPRVRNEPDIRRYEVYQRCLNSIKAWLDMFFSVPPELYTRLPCSIYCQLFYVMGCLHKITTTKDAAWNPAVARESVDLIPTLDRIIHTFEQLNNNNNNNNASTARPQEDEALTMGAKKFNALKIAWQVDVASSKDAGAGAFPTDTGIVDGPQGFYPTLPMDYYGFHMLPGMLDGVPWQ